MTLKHIQVESPKIIAVGTHEYYKRLRTNAANSNS